MNKQKIGRKRKIAFLKWVQDNCLDNIPDISKIIGFQVTQELIDFILELEKQKISIQQIKDTLKSSRSKKLPTQQNLKL